MGYLTIAEDFKLKTMDSSLLSLGSIETLLCLSVNIWVWGIFSLEIDEDDTKNIDFFGRVKEEIGKLCEMPIVIGEANCKDDFKPWRVDWDKNVNASIYSGLYDGVNILIWKLVEGKKKRIYSK